MRGEGGVRKREDERRRKSEEEEEIEQENLQKEHLFKLEEDASHS